MQSATSPRAFCLRGVEHYANCGTIISLYSLLADGADVREDGPGLILLQRGTGTTSTWLSSPSERLEANNELLFFRQQVLI